MIDKILQAKKLGYKTRSIYLWDTCPICNKQRWVRRRNRGILCRSCARKRVVGSRCPRWNGGKKTSRGYIYIFVKKDHPFFLMAQKDGKGHSIAEHRLVVAELLGRCLNPKEIVHHINGIKNDNRSENLELISRRRDHLSLKYLRSAIAQLESRVLLLEVENQRLNSMLERYGNPELADSEKSRASVETLYGVSLFLGIVRKSSPKGNFR